MTRYTKESVAELLEQFYKENKRPPKMDEMNSDHHLPTVTTVKRVMGMTPSQYIKKKHPKRKKAQSTAQSAKKKLTNEDIIQQYRDFYLEHNRVPNAKECKANGLVYPATFKRAAGQSPASYFRNAQTAPPEANEKSKQAIVQPFFQELLGRLGTSVEDLSSRTSIPAEKIVELLTKEPPEEFRQLCSIAKALEVPVEILFSQNRKI